MFVYIFFFKWKAKEKIIFIKEKPPPESGRGPPETPVFGWRKGWKGCQGCSPKRRRPAPRCCRRHPASHGRSPDSWRHRSSCGLRPKRPKWIAGSPTWTSNPWFRWWRWNRRCSEPWQNPSLYFSVPSARIAHLYFIEARSILLNKK